MKSLKWIICILLLVLTPSLVLAQDAIITLPSTTLTVGERADLNVMINCTMTRCGGLDIAIGYNPALLQIDRVEVGSYWSDSGSPLPIINHISALDGSFSLAVVTLNNGTNNPPSEGVALRFAVTALAEGVHELRGIATQAASLTGEGIGTTVIPGNITIVAPPSVEPSVSLVPQTAIVDINDPVLITAEVENIDNLYGLSLNCEINKSILRGENASPGMLFDPVNNLSIVQPHADTGEWKIAATQRKPAPVLASSGVAFNMNLIALADGLAEVICRVEGATAQGDVTQFPTASTTIQILPDPTPIPTDGGGDGTIDLPEPPVVDGAEDGELLPGDNEAGDPSDLEPPPPGADLEEPVNVEEEEPATLVRILSRIVNAPANTEIVLRLPDNTEQIIAPQADGTIIFEDIVPGAYTITARAPLHLSASADINVGGDQDFILGPVSLLIGDVNSDMAIDINDANIVFGSYGQMVPPASLEADLVPDGAITIADITVYANNFGVVGTQPWVDISQ